MATPHRQLLKQRPELIKRYVRIAVLRWTKSTALSLARRISRPKLQWSERKRKKVVASTLITFAAEAARARRLGFQANATVLNLALFFLTAERDLQAMKVDALTHPDPWVRGLCARVMLLTIHELDFDKVAGSRLREALDVARTPEPLRREVTEAMRTVRRAQSKAQRMFAPLRNATIAHRDADALKQYRDIESIDTLEVFRVCGDFYEGTTHFIKTVPRLIAQMGTTEAMLSQMALKESDNRTSS